MIYLGIYLLIGLLTYPAAMDMWYRVRYKRNEFVAPSGIWWYFGFLLFITTWIISFPLLTTVYLKEMSE